MSKPFLPTQEAWEITAAAVLPFHRSPPTSNRVFQGSSSSATSWYVFWGNNIGNVHLVCPQASVGPNPAQFWRVEGSEISFLLQGWSWPLLGKTFLYRIRRCVCCIFVVRDTWQYLSCVWIQVLIRNALPTYTIPTLAVNFAVLSKDTVEQKETGLGAWGLEGNIAFKTQPCQHELVKSSHMSHPKCKTYCDGRVGKCLGAVDREVSGGRAQLGLQLSITTAWRRVVALCAVGDRRD